MATRHNKHPRSYSKSPHEIRSHFGSSHFRFNEVHMIPIGTLCLSMSLNYPLSWSDALANIDEQHTDTSSSNQWADVLADINVDDIDNASASTTPVQIPSTPHDDWNSVLANICVDDIENASPTPAITPPASPRGGDCVALVVAEQRPTPALDCIALALTARTCEFVDEATVSLVEKGLGREPCLHAMTLAAESINESADKQTVREKKKLLRSSASSLSRNRGDRF